MFDSINQIFDFIVYWVAQIAQLFTSTVLVFVLIIVVSSWVVKLFKRFLK